MNRSVLDWEESFEHSVTGTGHDMLPNGRITGLWLMSVNHQWTKKWNYPFCDQMATTAEPQELGALLKTRTMCPCVGRAKSPPHGTGRTRSGTHMGIDYRRDAMDILDIPSNDRRLSNPWALPHACAAYKRLLLVTPAPPIFTVIGVMHIELPVTV